jgi:hypothetical protein
MTAPSVFADPVDRVHLLHERRWVNPTPLCRKCHTAFGGAAKITPTLIELVVLLLGPEARLSSNARLVALSSAAHAGSLLAYASRVSQVGQERLERGVALE